MKRIALLLCALVPSFGISAQVNLEEIRKLSADKATAYYYDSLVQEFLTNPGDFEMSKGITLYYGKLFSDDYQPYSFSPQLTNFDEAFRLQDYRRAIVLGEKIVEKDPVDFTVLLKLLRCYLEEKEEEAAQFTRMQVDVLYKAILHSGDGSSPESAIKVLQVADEYAIMALTDTEGISRRSQVGDSSILDVWKVRSAAKGGKDVMYFEVLSNSGRKSGDK